MRIKAAVKKVPLAVVKLLKIIVTEAKPDEIQIWRDGSVIVKYKKSF